jgi:hypothetical protein
MQRGFRNETPDRIHRRIDRRFLAIPGIVGRGCDGVAVMAAVWFLFAAVLTVAVLGWVI